MKNCMRGNCGHCEICQVRLLAEHQQTQAAAVSVEKMSADLWGETTPKKENILQEADRLTSGARREEYGDTKKSLNTIAVLWSPILGREITGREVYLCMIQLKVVRQLNGHKRDSLVDICGYARIGEIWEDG